MSDLKIDETGASIVPVLACVLNQLCSRNDRLNLGTPPTGPPGSPQHGMSKFHALRPPAIGIKDYLNRIAKYAACSGECFVLSLVYIDRIIQSNPSFVVNSLNIHRLLITSIMLAAKFFDDQYYNNAYYAKVGGVPTNEVNALEVEFLFMANFTLCVSADTYQQYYTELCNHSSNVNNTCSCATSGIKIPPLVIPSWPHLRDVDESELFYYVHTKDATVQQEEYNFIHNKMPWMNVKLDEETDAHGVVTKVSSTGSSSSSASSSSSSHKDNNNSNSSSTSASSGISSSLQKSNSSSNPSSSSSNNHANPSNPSSSASTSSSAAVNYKVSVTGVAGGSSSSAAMMSGGSGGLTGGVGLASSSTNMSKLAATSSATSAASASGTAASRASAVGVGYTGASTASANALLAAQKLQQQQQ